MDKKPQSMHICRGMRHWGAGLKLLDGQWQFGFQLWLQKNKVHNCAAIVRPVQYSKVSTYSGWAMMSYHQLEGSAVKWKMPLVLITHYVWMLVSISQNFLTLYSTFLEQCLLAFRSTINNHELLIVLWKLCCEMPLLPQRCDRKLCYEKLMNAVPSISHSNEPIHDCQPFLSSTYPS